MHREGVAQRVRRDRFADAVLAPHDATGVLDGRWGDRLSWDVAGEQPLLGTGSAPIVAQKVEQCGREHDVSVLASLALLDTDHHALAVDRAWLQTHRLRDAQSGGVADSEDDALLEALNRVEEVGDFGW